MLVAIVGVSMVGMSAMAATSTNKTKTGSTTNSGTAHQTTIQNVKIISLNPSKGSLMVTNPNPANHHNINIVTSGNTAFLIGGSSKKSHSGKFGDLKKGDELMTVSGKYNTNTNTLMADKITVIRGI